MPLYRGELTLETRLNEGETVKVVLLKEINEVMHVYLVYELGDKVPRGKPAGYGLMGGTAESNERIYDTAYRETINEAGFVTKPKMILYVENKRSFDLRKAWHRMAVVLSEITGFEEARVLETDEVDPNLSGWFPLSKLPAQIVKMEGETEVVEREGIYISHFKILTRLYSDNIITVRPFCEDIMHTVAEKPEAAREADLSQESVERINEGPTDDTTGWSEEAIADLGEKKSLDREARDDEYRRWAESPATT